MSPALRSHFADYARFHATSGNQACHSVGIPIIVFAILAMLAHVSVAPVGGFMLTAAELLLAAITIYYLTLDAVLALLMLLVASVFVAAGRHVPLLPALSLFVIGWILQFVGHYVYEKKAPAFFQNLTHLLVGPLWILAKAVGRA
jgi:uncharacterized membrane protein YGL010W